MSAIFTRYRTEFLALPGWFSQESAAVWDSLLSFQTAAGIKGDFLEIGLWSGKSAVLSTLHAQASEHCIFVDPIIRNDAKIVLNRIAKAILIYKEMPSQKLSCNELLSANVRPFRWVHIDGDNSGPAIKNDLDVGTALLGDKGILVLNGFFDPAYPQITATVFQWLRAHTSELQHFLCGFKKGYLCRTQASGCYNEFIKDHLFDELDLRGHSNVTIWKTTAPPDMNCFGITGKYLDFDYRGPDCDEHTIQI